MIEMGQKSLLGKARARPDLVRQAWAKAQKEGFISVFKEAMNRLDEPFRWDTVPREWCWRWGPGSEVSSPVTGWPRPGRDLPPMPK